MVVGDAALYGIELAERAGLRCSHRRKMNLRKLILSLKVSTVLFISILSSLYIPPYYNC